MLMASSPPQIRVICHFSSTPANHLGAVSLVDMEADERSSSNHFQHAPNLSQSSVHSAGASSTKQQQQQQVTGR